MGKTFEALQRSQKEHDRELFQPVPYEPKPVQAFPGPASPSRFAPAWCRELWSKCTLGGHKILLVTGVSSGSGCTTAVGYYAAYLAFNLSLKVLVLDMNSIDPSGMKRFFLRQDKRSLVELFTPRAIQTVKSFETLKRNLVVVTADEEPFEELSRWIASPQFSTFLQRAAGQFDVVLLDTAPVQFSMETRVLVSKVDGVILMLESGRTRRGTALKIRKELLEAGANLVGTVINKRRYYIPNWLYSRL